MSESTEEIFTSDTFPPQEHRKSITKISNPTDNILFISSVHLIYYTTALSKMQVISVEEMNFLKNKTNKRYVTVCRPIITVSRHIRFFQFSFSISVIICIITLLLYVQRLASGTLPPIPNSGILHHVFSLVSHYRR